MSSVDNRVVKMTFDNEQFEKKVRDTMNTLSEFEKKLKLDGATTGIDGVGKAANKLDISALGNKAEKESSRIDSSASDMQKSISKIDDAAEDADFSPISKSAESAAEGVNDAIDDINLSGIATEAENAAQGFSAMEAVATGALLGIGNSIESYVIGKLSSLGSMVKSFTLDPIAEGFGEYELQTNSIQTILANTGRNFGSDQDIQDVNDALGELNDYADKTIYKFSDMTEAIGSFTTAGLSLEEATSAVKGVSNLAAFSGASTSQLHGILPQISQALTGDYLTVMDWKSFQNRQMAPRAFEEALADMAEHMAQTQFEVGEIDEATLGWIKSAAEDVHNGMSIYNSLNKDTGHGQWISSDVLAETLQLFTYDDDTDQEVIKHLEELGFTTEEMNEIFKQAKVATQSATEVRTWTQLWDTVDESIGTGWADVWKNIVGDFKESTDTFTFLSQNITGVIDDLFSGISNTAEVFNKSGARELIFGGFLRDENGDIPENAERIVGALDNVVAAIGKPLQAIKDAFNDVFGMDTDTLAINLIEIAGGIKNFTESLIISDNMAEGIKGIFKGLFSVLDVGLQIVLDLVAAFGGFIDVIRTITDPLLDIAAALGGVFGEALKWVRDRFFEIRDAVIEATQPIRDAIDVVKRIIERFFELADIPGKIRGVADFFGDLLTLLWEFLDIPGKIAGLGDVFSGFFNWVGDLTGWNEAIRTANDYLERTGEKLEIVDVWFEQLTATPFGKFLQDIYDGIVNLFPPFGDFITAITTSDENVRHTIVLNMWNDIREQLVKITGPLSEFFGMIASGFADVMPLVGDFIGSLLTGFGEAVILVANLVGAIGGFAIELGNAFLSWEPIQNIINKLNDFKDGAINFFLSLPQKIGAMAGDLSGELGGVEGIFGGVIKWFEDTTNYFNTITVEQFLEDLKTWANGIIDGIQGVFEFLSNLTPDQAFAGIQTAIVNLYNDLTDKVAWIEEHFPGLHGVLSTTLQNIFGTIFSIVSDIKNFLLPIFEKSENLPEFFSNLLEAIRIAWNDKLDAIREVITNFDVSKAFEDMFGKIGDIGQVVHNFVHGIAKQIEDNLPSLSGVLTGGLENISGIISDKVGAIKGFLTPIIKESESLPEFFRNLLKAIGTEISNGIQGIINWITSFTPEKFFAGWSGFSTTLYGIIQGWFPDIAPFIEPIFNGISDFFSDITNGAEGWDDVFVNLVGKIAEGIQDLPNVIGNILEAVKTVIGGAISNITEKLGGITGPVGEFFSGIHDSLFGMDDDVTTVSKSMPGKFDAMFDISGSVKGANEELNGFWNWFKLDNIPEHVGSFVDTFKGFISDKFDKIKEFVSTDIAPMIGEVADTLSASLSSGELETIATIITDVFVVKLLGGLTKFVEAATGAIPTFASTLHELTKTLDNYVIGKKYESLSTKALKIAGAVGILAAAVWVISTIQNPWEAVAILGAVGAIMAILLFIAGLIENSPFSGGGDSLLKAAGSIVVFAAGLWLLMKVVEDLTTFDWKANEKGLQYVGDAVVALIAITWLIGNGGEHAMQAAAGMAIMVGVLWLLLPVIKDYVEFANSVKKEDYEKVAATLAAMAGALVIMAVAMRIAGDHGISAGVGFILMAAALAIIKNVLVELSAVDMEGLTNAFWALAILMGEFAGIAKLTKEADLMGTAVSLIVFGVAVGVLALSLAGLASVDSDGVAVAATALGALIVVFGLLAALTNETDLVQTAASLLIFGVAVGLLALSLAGLSTVPWESLITAAGAISILIVAFGLLVAITQEGDLVVTAASLIIFSVAVGLLALSLAGLAMVDPERLQAAAIAIGAIIGVFGLIAAVLSIPVLSEAAMIILPELALAFLAVGGAALLIGAGLMLAVEAITQLANAGPILAAFATIVSEHAGDFLIAAGTLAAFGIAIIPLGAGLLIFGAGAVVAGGGLVLLAEGVRAILELIPDLPGLIENAGNTIADFFNNLPEHINNAWTAVCKWFDEVLIPGLGDFFTGIFGKLGELIDGFMNWLQTDALPALGTAADQFWTWVNTEAIPNLGNFITEVGTKLGELLDTAGNWIQNEGLPMLGRAASDFWNWVKTEGIPKLGDFIKEVVGKLGELLDAAGKWIRDEGLPMLGQAASDFWNWAKTEGFPMLARFIEGVFTCLGDLLKQLANWIVNEGIPAAGKAVQDILGELGKMGEQLLEWGMSLPGKALEGIQNAWNTLLDIGGNIVDGIVQGLGDGAQAVINAVTGLGESALQGIKDFFGIASPSKVMAEEVGQYIPAGLAAGIDKYASLATDSGSALGSDTAQSINDSLGDIQAQFNIDGTANVVPVVTPENLDAFKTDMTAGLGDVFGDVGADVTNEINTSNRIDAEMNTGSLNSTIDGQTNDLMGKLEELVYYTSHGNDSIIQSIRSAAAARQNVYLDSGQLVGAITPMIDQSLGDRYSMASRGVY